jgi:prophage regulatory protein
MPKKITFEEINHGLPSEGYVRLWQIIGGKGYPPLIPISKSSWWNGIRAGIYPEPVRTFGKRMSLWRVEDIRKLTNKPSETAQ